MLGTIYTRVDIVSGSTGSEESEVEVLVSEVDGDTIGNVRNTASDHGHVVAVNHIIVIKVS